MGKKILKDKKGFSLIEVTIAIIILGILTAIAIPNYMTMVVQGEARATQNNLMVIFNAQKNYYFTNGTYCGLLAGDPSNCNSLNSGASSINTLLSLNINDPNFNYSCQLLIPSGFQCTATSVSDANLILTLTNNPIVLPGGTGCATNAGPAATRAAPLIIPLSAPISPAFSQKFYEKIKSFVTLRRPA